ncbi:TetR family transcriptional regulator [Streptomyces sp. Ru71]|nr:TetR family transcriptional regulator [Streptomyces sp. Ru71]
MAGTRREIARVACRLFAERGADATTAEEIAAEAGVGLRTFYRYFRSKEDAVEPMLADGARRWLSMIPDTPGTLPDTDALRELAVTALTPEDEQAAEAMRLTGGLLRAAEEDPALRTVWARINLEAEQALAAQLAERAGTAADPFTVRMLAAAAAGAIRVAVEEWARHPDAPTVGRGSPSDLVTRSVLALTAAFPGRRRVSEPPASPSPARRRARSN